MIAVSIDGTLVAPERASVSVFDRGFLYGDGCFEVLRTWDGVARDLDAHLERLYETAAFLQLRMPERARLVEWVYRTIAAVDVPVDKRLRIVATRGDGSLAERLAAIAGGRTIVIVEPLPPQPLEVTLAVVDWPVARRARGHKTLAYLDSVIAKELARAAGADEAVRLDADERVVECATSNVFAVLGGTVVTPPTDRGALPGVVRARLLALCASAGIASRVRDLTVRDLRGADELFVTSSLRGVVPVVRLDDTAFTAGRVTSILSAAYVAAMRAREG